MNGSLVAKLAAFLNQILKIFYLNFIVMIHDSN